MAVGGRGVAVGGIGVAVGGIGVAVGRGVAVAFGGGGGGGLVGGVVVVPLCASEAEAGGTVAEVGVVVPPGDGEGDCVAALELEGLGEAPPPAPSFEAVADAVLAGAVLALPPVS